MTILAKACTYFLFSFIIGTVVISLVPMRYRPSLSYSKKWLVRALVLFLLLSFVPVLQLALSVGEDVGIWQALNAILFTFAIGKGWLFLVLFTSVLIGVVSFGNMATDRFLAGIATVLCLMIVGAVGYSSHAASLSPQQGFIAQSLHFFAVTSWPGILFVVSWCSQGKEGLPAFFRWFTPFALVCLGVTVGAGIWLMSWITPQYVNAWMMNYGQLLLMKHILLVVVVFYALVNTVFVRAKLKNDTFSPFPWLRAESLVLIVIFFVTGAMSEQEPPHHGEKLMTDEKPSPLFSQFASVVPVAGKALSLQWNVEMGLFMLLSGVFFVLCYQAMKKDVHYAFVLLLSLCAGVLLYVSMMTAVH
ncbi:copper export protein-like protein [Fictibacillus macauensis ZFHKF-1]|uniref:Copper export protein-like protein n=1 Tax=Fictibacillus macauensis ZFHKF-1 TaxID=1196324 RepID=I8UJT1_9BACL|nr:CopD family protein [Fictibacillus macauensis]EIT87135.1 copper export protein-like protein [Fictibacillus macauensis ZFHKF-1]